MTPRIPWRDNRRIVLHLGLFTGCCLLAVVIRVAIAADTLNDLPSVALQVGGLLVFIVTTIIATTAAFRVRGRSETVVLRLLPVGLVLVGAIFVEASYADVSVALNDLTAQPDPSSPSLLVLGPGGRDVRLTGDLTEGVASRLADLLAAHPSVVRIHLTSDGGLADEGEALRGVIGAHRLITFVPDFCVSACTLAFLGGRERLVMKGARLGFHAPYEQGLFGQTFATEKNAERDAYISAGVAPNFVDAALKVAPNDLWTPDEDRLFSAHVVTGVVSPYRFPDSNLDGVATLSGARDLVLRNFPLARKLDVSRPQAVDIIAAWYLDAYQKGVSEGDVVDGIRSKVAGSVQGSPLALSLVDSAH